MTTEIPEKLKIGPKDSVTYPLIVPYCGHCSMPIEYCEYYPEYEKCKVWLEKNLPNEFEKIKLGDNSNATTGGTITSAGAGNNEANASATGGGGEDDKKRQKRGGKGIMKTKKPKEDGPKRICLSRAPRGKKKSVTVVTGLSTYDIDLKVAAKFFGTKFACGSSVTGDDEIVIQGDVKDDLFDVIPEKWPEIDEDSIDDLGDQKR
uniref:Density-regulated protein n=1 Tax=Corethrella appendiculata TaxID=1370023 RepID=U5EHC2_9DIPT